MYPVKLASNGLGHVHVENGKYKRRKGMRARYLTQWTSFLVNAVILYDICLSFCAINALMLCCYFGAVNA